MTAKLLERILRDGGVPDLLKILGERLPPTDLQSLLLEVFRRRAARQTPAGLLEHEGSHRFEIEALHEHLGFHLRLLPTLRENGFFIGPVRVVITILDQDVAIEMASLASAFPDVRFDLAAKSTRSQGYYETLRFKLFVEDSQGTEHELGDGGFTDWTRKLLSNQKERLLVSGLGTERVCQVYR